MMSEGGGVVEDGECLNAGQVGPEQVESSVSSQPGG